MSVALPSEQALPSLPAISYPNSYIILEVVKRQLCSNSKKCGNSFA